MLYLCQTFEIKTNKTDNAKKKKNMETKPKNINDIATKKIKILIILTKR